MAKKAAKKASKKAANVAPEQPVSKKQIESYAHTDKKRANNPPVWLVTSDSEPPAPAKKTYAYDPHLDPQLMWAGKTERTSFEVPTVSLHVHERIDPKAIIAAVRTNGDRAKPRDDKPRQLSLFEEPEEYLPLREPPSASADCMLQFSASQRNLSQYGCTTHLRSSTEY